jgi:hypothetical protein
MTALEAACWIAFGIAFCGWGLIAYRLEQRFYDGDPRTQTAILLWPLLLTFYVISIAITLGFYRLSRCSN